MIDPAARLQGPACAPATALAINQALPRDCEALFHPREGVAHPGTHDRIHPLDGERLAIALATFRIRSLDRLSVAAEGGKQPRGVGRSRA